MGYLPAFKSLFFQGSKITKQSFQKICLGSISVYITFGLSYMIKGLVFKIH